MHGPRELPADTPLDELEDEVIDTQAALRADPDAEDLAPGFEAQLTALDVVFDRERQTRREKVEAAAVCRVADGRLDPAIVLTGKQLEVVVKGDKSSPTWTRAFGSSTPSDIGRLPRAKEVTRVSELVAALTAVGSAALTDVIASLTLWSGRLGAGLERLRTANASRGQYVGDREEYVIALNRARRSLSGALIQRAAERGLPKDWPATFFRKSPRRDRAEEPSEPTGPTGGGE